MMVQICRVQFVWKSFDAMPVHPSHNCPKPAGMASMETQQLSIYSDLSWRCRIEYQGKHFFSFFPKNFMDSIRDVQKYHLWRKVNLAG